MSDQARHKLSAWASVSDLASYELSVWAIVTNLAKRELSVWATFTILLSVWATVNVLVTCELSVRATVTNLARPKRALSLPNKSMFGSHRDGVFESLSEDQLCSHAGLQLILEFLGDELAGNAVDGIIEEWDDLDRYHRTEGWLLEEFHLDFGTKYG